MMQSRIGIRRMRVAPDLEMGNTEKKKKQKESKEKEENKMSKINYYGMKYGIRRTYSEGQVLAFPLMDFRGHPGPAGNDPIEESEPEYWRVDPNCWAH